jgi:CheY-like chemotaxis protein
MAERRLLKADGIPPRVLVVEDEALIALDIETTLRSLGCVVVGPVATVEQALRALVVGWPDAAILDVNLGHEQVFPVADRLAERNVPFMFLTGYSPDILPSRHRARPVASKPCRAEALARLLAPVLDVR